MNNYTPHKRMLPVGKVSPVRKVMPAPKETVLTYRAVASFDAQHPDDLRIQPGDIIQVDAILGRTEPGWLKGSTGGRTGLFPQRYAELLADPGGSKLPSSPRTLPKLPGKSPQSPGFKKPSGAMQPWEKGPYSPVAIQPFQGVENDSVSVDGGDRETIYEVPLGFEDCVFTYEVRQPYKAQRKGELSVKVGDLLEVKPEDECMRKGWVYGECRDQVGFVPEYLLKLVEEELPEEQPFTSPIDPFPAKSKQVTTSKSSTTERPRLAAIYELRDALEAFVKDLIKADEILKPLRERKWTSQDEVQKLSQNHQELFSPSRTLLRTLENSAKESREEPSRWSIGGILCEKQPKVKDWIAYWSLHKDLRAFLSKQPAIQKVFKISDKSSEITEDDIRTYFEMPQEFIHQYPVLIEKILENTPTDHPDFPDLVRANAIAKGNCDQISQKLEVMKHIYDMQRMENIIKFKRESDRIKFVCGTSGLGPRRVIFTSVLQELRDGREIECVMFLTNDFLLITYPVKPLHGMTAEKYMDVQTKVVLNAKGPVIYLNLVEVMKRETDEHTTLYLSYETTGTEVSILNLKTATATDRQVWITQIEEAKRSFMDAKKEIYPLSPGGDHLIDDDIDGPTSPTTHRDLHQVKGPDREEPTTNVRYRSRSADGPPPLPPGREGNPRRKVSDGHGPPPLPSKPIREEREKVVASKPKPVNAVSVYPPSSKPKPLPRERAEPRSPVNRFKSELEDTLSKGFAPFPEQGRKPVPPKKPVVKVEQPHLWEKH